MGVQVPPFALTKALEEIHFFEGFRFWTEVTNERRLQDFVLHGGRFGPLGREF